MDRRSHKGQVLFEALIFLLSILVLVGIFQIYEDDFKMRFKHYRWNRSYYERTRR